MSNLKELRSDLRNLANPAKAKILQGFFKTDKGEYGEGDIFLGVIVPESRKIAIKYHSLSLKETELLLKSKIHEERLIALLILVHNYEKYFEKRKEIFDFYIKNTRYINNWDLVDLSSHHIVGEYLAHRDKSILYRLARSKLLWDRRISIISTLCFIKNKDFLESLKLAEILLQDKHDLIQKATGWMLREIGKKDVLVLERFLKKYYKIMPRTTLRYAIEHFAGKKRKMYLEDKI